MDAVFAYIDLLGFSEYTRNDLPGAARLLDTHRETLANRLEDARTYATTRIVPAGIALDNLVTSFDHFLPFSDSIFIASKAPDLFVRQLATFLIQEFRFTGHAYAFPDDLLRPEEVKIHVAGTGLKEIENWFPGLWRGGLAYGQIESVPTNGISDGKPISLPLLVGPPILTAVRLEKSSGQGPRLFCEAGFKDRLTDVEIRRYFVPVPGKACDEFLWPIFLFGEGGRPKSEIGSVLPFGASGQLVAIEAPRSIGAPLLSIHPSGRS